MRFLKRAMEGAYWTAASGYCICVLAFPLGNRLFDLFWWLRD